MSEIKSCLVTRLNNYIDINHDLEKLIATLEKNEKHFPKGASVHLTGDKSKNLYVIRKGWFLSYVDLHDGGRVVIKIHHPGDIIGFEGIAYQYQSFDLKSSTEGILCPFDKKDLDVIFKRSPKLSALLFSLSVREQIIAIDRLKVVSRLSAKARLAYFLLDILFRLKVTNLSMKSEFQLPLTQSEIGDSIGLTNVSVSRAFSLMEANNLVKRTEVGIKLLDLVKLIELCDYEDRHTKIDTSWFPAS
ncbi:MAG: Crp/Fnr family transcriptional regulator [Methylophilaceae bacterium]